MDELKVKSRAIRELVDRSKKVLLHAHPSPDPDSYGSALGMLHCLQAQGKTTTLIKGDSPIPDFVQFLPGHEQVLAKNYLEINPADFDLFLILDSGGLDRISTLGPVNFPPTMKTVLIDHHATTADFADVNWIDPRYAATAEMLDDLLASWPVQISHDTAACFLLGLYTDTGGFKYDHTTANTFRAAAHLAEIAPDYSKIIFAMENNQEPGAIRFQGLALNRIETYFADRVALSVLSRAEIQEHQISENDSKGVTIANILKSVKNWEVGISLVEWELGSIKLSARTRDSVQFDLTKFVTLVGGGGHRAAAGAYLKLPLAEAKKLVLQKLGEAYPALLTKS